MALREERKFTQQRRLKRRREIRARQRRAAPTNDAVVHMAADVAAGPEPWDRDLRGTLVFGLQRLRAASGEVGRHLDQARGLLLERIREPRSWLAATSPDSTSFIDLTSRSPELPPKTAILGVAEDGRPVVMEFGQRHVTNVLVSGVAGAGKTTLLRSIAVSLAMDNRQSVLQLLVMDACGQGSHGSFSLLSPLDDLPHMLCPVVHGPERVTEALSFLVGELEHRRAQGQCSPVVVALLDNLDQLVGRYMAPASESLALLVQHGPQVGMHLVASARHIEGPFFDELIKANLPVRLVGRARDGRAASLASGVPESGAECLDRPGHFLAMMDGGPAIRFQAACLVDSELQVVTEQLHRCRPRPLLAQTAPPATTGNGTQGAGHSSSVAWSHPSRDHDGPMVSVESEDELAPD